MAVSPKMATAVFANTVAGLQQMTHLIPKNQPYTLPFYISEDKTT